MPVNTPKGILTCASKTRNNEIEIHVRDFGEGIAPEILPHIFDRFYRGEDQNTIPGFGLGLPITKTLVE
jgi:signal transduction histidine kinase